MASSKEYLEYVLEQLTELYGITYRYMMGEYIIYYKGKVAGGIYDDRFLIKATPKALKFIENPKLERPYPKGKEMILIEDIDDKYFLRDLFNEIYDEINYPNSR